MGGNNEEVQKEKRPSGDTPIEAIRASRPAKTADGIREWFSTLSVEDRASALGFVDDTILSALLKHALLASSFSSHNIESIPGSRTDKNGSNGSIRPIFDWHGNVSMSDFEKTSEMTPVNKNEETINSVDVIETAIEESKAKKLEPRSPSNGTSETTEHSLMVVGGNAKKESEAIELSDAFRIRDIKKESSPISKESGEGAVEASSDTIPNAATNETETKIAEIMNSICIIFSLNKELNVSDATRHAYITLQPSYLRTRNGVDVFGTLEEILSHALPTHSFFDTLADSSWDSLRLSVFSNAKTGLIPLYAALALRMKSAIFESYRQSMMADTTTGTCSSPAASNKGISGTTTASANETVDKTANAEKEDDSSTAFFATISACLVRLNGLPEIEEARLLELSGSSYAAGNLDSLVKEGRCMIIPFHHLLRAMKSHLSQKSDLFTDDAVTQVVQNLVQEALESSPKNHPSLQGSQSSTPNTTNSDDPPKIPSEQDVAKAPSEPSKSNEQQPQKQGGGGKRKKRKQKKKKKKGNHNQGQNGGTKTQAQATQQQLHQGVLSQPEKEELSIQKEDTSAIDGEKSVEGKSETDKPRGAGKDERISTSLIEDSETTSDKTDVAVAPDNLVAKPSEEVVVDDDSDSDDDRKNDSTEQLKDEVGKQQPTKEANNSKIFSQQIIAPLTTIGDIENDDSGEWETVEVKVRGNRKKAADRANQNRFQSQQHGQSHGGQNGTGSKKSKTRNTIRKQRSNMRKMVREILSNVLDRVDEDVQKRRLARREVSHTTVNKWGIGTTSVLKGSTNANALTSLTNQPKDMSMRDIIVSRHGDNPPKVQGVANRLRQRDSRSAHGQIRRGADGYIYREKKTATGASVDQNTAPTITETLSAVSVETFTRNVPTQGAEAAQGDSSSGDSVAGSKPQSSQTGKVVTPPLPTLLSPENANSASSSVASSLDTSHAGHQSNHVTSQQGKEKDVGYHLLDVCDRLTRDINIFMKRREHALEARRRERGAVLMALQGTVSSIWPNLCNVEMYGSCATQLDLPSSDLDVVVTGLYKPAEALQSGMMVGNSRRMTEASHNSVEKKPDSRSSGMVSDDNLAKDPSKDRKTAQHSSHPHAGYGQLSQNAERIVRLAVELERQPWAVHVKAIPTASVPVIKILADPTRIFGNGEWLMQAPSIAEAGAVGNNGQGMMGQNKANSNAQTSMPRFQSQQSLPWRGADVMNGLLKVDITFEGPEHGGIGSTKFSSRVVKEFCDETGLLQDGTPAVQALMVVKELLAQRRLNEPFSGGLSSYALLLLVISVLRERAIIREELERVERQRRLVASDDADQSIGIPSNQTSLSTEKTPSNRRAPKVAQPTAQKTNSKRSWNAAARGGASSSAATKAGAKNIQARPSGRSIAAVPAKAASSSWASIAMKSKSPSHTPKANQAGPQKAGIKANGQQAAKTVRKASSFADAVANGRRAAKQQQAGKAAPQQQTRKDEAQRNQKSKTAPLEKSNALPEQKPVNQSATRPNASSVPSPKLGSAAVGVQGAQLQSDDAAFDEGQSLFPQGFHDVTEVLCSGETTPGKLLMHFLLFYGQHFDSQSTAIDYSGTHEREMNNNNGYSQGSPYLRRRSGGSYDPMTGMLTVDPIIVYDPLEGAETSNVARSCFAWSSIRWVFAQSYLTLLSTVEINQNHANGQGGNVRGISRNDGKSGSTSQNENQLSHPWNGPYGHDKSGNMMIDASSPLLELLLSF